LKVYTDTERSSSLWSSRIDTNVYRPIQTSYSDTFLMLWVMVILKHKKLYVVKSNINIMSTSDTKTYKDPA